MTGATPVARRRLTRLSGRDSVVTRTLVASTLLALILVASFAVLLVALRTLRSTNEQEGRSKDVTVATLRLEKLVLDLETGLRGYVLTGNNKFLDPWHEARRQLPAAITTLQGLTADNGAQNVRARQLIEDVRDYESDYAVPLVRIAAIDREAARGPVATGEGRRRLDALRSEFDRFVADDRRRVAAREASATREARRAIGLGVGALVLSALMTLAFGAYLARAIARPVRNAAAGAERVAAGDLSTRLSEKGPGEIGQLTRAFNQMTGSLEQSQRDLVDQNARLRESERLKSELVSVVSHELRTPLSSIIGYATLLQQREFDPPTRERYLEIIENEGRRLAALVEDFLDADRLERGTLELDLEPLDLRTVLSSQARLFSGQSADHMIVLDLPDEPLPVTGDGERLAQVAGNMISNAIKYSPEGGGVLVAGELDGETVRFLVRDEGLGISPSDRSRVFTRFYRGSAPASGIPGTGLGLAVAREIVEAHGGHIGFSSEEGRGSTFWVELPALAVELLTRAAGETPAEVGGERAS